MTDATIQIRRAQPEDVEQILDLLETTEFIRPLTRNQLRSIFDYDWVDQKPGLGILLTHGDRSGGFGSMVYSPPRTVAGTRYVTVSVGTFFIEPAYRARRTPTGVVRYSDQIVQAAMKDGLTLAFSAKGPNDVVAKLLAAHGFEELSSAEVFSPLGAGWRTLLRPSGTVLVAPGDVRDCLTEEQLAILHDHEPYGCRFFMLLDGERRCFVVTKRRRYRGEWLWPRLAVDRIRRHPFPISDILHISDPEVALRSWGRFVARVCLADRTVGVTCAQSFVGPTALKGTLVPQKILAYGRTIPVQAVDKLYSEVVLLV